MKPDRPTILVVDDEPKYVRALKAILNADGYETLGAYDGAEALKIAEQQELALILLDVRMPRMSGFEVCRQVRTFSTVPVVMLTAMAQKSEIVTGLEVGADDYLTKPFSTDELLSRVRAVLRRSHMQALPTRQSVFQTGDLHIHYTRGEVHLAGQRVELTPTEYRLLCELSFSAGCVVPASMLLEKVWGPGYLGDERMVQRVIHRLRRKIEPDPSQLRYVITRPGLGYLLEAYPANDHPGKDG